MEPVKSSALMSGPALVGSFTLEPQHCPPWRDVFLEQLSDVGCDQEKLVLESKGKQFHVWMAYR